MKINKSTFFLSLMVLLTASAKAQDTAMQKQSMTLEQCIEYALKNNIQIKQSVLSTEVSEINLLQSKGNLFPSLNANGSHSYNYGRTIDRFTNQFATKQVISQNLSLSGDITLFNGLQNINTIHQNRYNYLSNKYGVDKLRNDVALNVATVYLQILYAMELVDNTGNQLGITTAQIERAKKLLDAGTIAKGALLDIQAQLATEEYNNTTAQNQLDIAYLTLAQLLNLPSAEGFGIAKPAVTIGNETLLTTDPNQIYTTAIATLPQIKKAEYAVKSAEKGIDVAWGGLSPRLSFSAAYGTGYSGASQRIANNAVFTGFTPNGDVTGNGDVVYSPTFSMPIYEKIPYFDQYRDNVNKSFGFYLTIPIFNRFQTKFAIDRARIQKINAELEVEATKLQIQKEVQQSYADASAGFKKYAASLKAVEAIQESFNYTEQKFNVGIVNTNDYNDAKNKLIKAQSDLLQAKYEYIFKIKVLDFYQGKPLKL